MYDILDQIHYDHISMSKVLHIMEQEVFRIEADMDPDYNLLVDGMRYMVNYSDAVHHPKEDALFDRLSEKKPDLTESIADIRQQHETLAEKSSQFYDIVKKAAVAEEFVSKDEISGKGHDYIGILRKHMNIEEGDLLRKAKKFLSKNDMVEVDQQYSAFSDPLLSDSLEREYNSLYHSLVSR
jgi:hemerythrin-like domain-containing protein